MDFSFSDEQQQIAELAKRIFTDHASHERVRQIERAGGPRFDRELWAEAARAGLLGIAVPQAHGGAGLGFFEVALVVEQMARAAAPIPLLETIVTGALPIAEYGTDAQRNAWLPKVVEGEAILTAALTEDQADPQRPTTTARKDGASWRISGIKTCVPAGDLADLLLVPAAADGKVVVLLVEAATPGLRTWPLLTTSGQPEARIELDDVRVGADAVLGTTATGGAVLAWIEERATTALACVALGVCEQALALTSDYTKNRKQFDQPIAMFQAVGQRLADAYIDVEAIRLTTWQAAWRLAVGLPAETQVAIAKYWAGAGGQRVVHTAQHLHGGMGVDRDYPLHRYFLYAKQLELQLGGTTTQLRRLGRLIAAEANA
ncbi:MAG: acyl-CoA/acyl-ACP dehydrogenase [Deltaproteobacteria bacterium]|nr:acyl-CoA/acyl-ACP dehydrogenase [Deltaproteobacteria bacterium]